MCFDVYFVYIKVHGCAEGWLEFMGNCYLHFAGRLTWSDAEQRCQDINAHLVSISSQEEQQFVNCEYLKVAAYSYNDCRCYFMKGVHLFK